MSATTSYPVAPESTPFKISPSAYLRHSLSGAKGKAVIIVPVACVAGFIVVGVLIGDFRFLLVALILLFIAVPMVMAIGYFSITLSPAATQSILLHTVELLPDGSIRIAYLAPEAEDSDATHPPFPPEIIDYAQIESLHISGDFIIYRLLSGRLVIIPIDSLNLPSGWHCHFRDFD